MKFIEKTLGKVAVDGGMLMIMDPSYLDNKTDILKVFKDGKFKQGTYSFKAKYEKDKEVSGRSYLFGTLGGDGTFDIVARYDKDSDSPHIPVEVVIKIKESIMEGAWGSGPLDNNSASGFVK
jgi:hypothetical protein